MSDPTPEPTDEATPGPWHVSPDHEYPLHLIWSVRPNGLPDNLIARTCFAPASEANARLISLAPELRDMLRELCEEVEEHQLGRPETIRVARDLLSKLGGG